MSAHDDVFHLEVRDGVGDDALAVDVGWWEDVGDVAVHEDVARLEAQHGGFRDAGVGAADPEDLRVLAGGEGGEEVRVGGGGGLGPLFVLVEGEFEGVCGVGGGLLEFCFWGVGLVGEEEGVTFRSWGGGGLGEGSDGGMGKE